MSRGLLVPAVVCLVAGLALGAWGWGERDDSRRRLVGEDVETLFGDDEDPPLFGDGPSRREDACTALYGVAALQLPSAGPGMADPAGPGDPDEPFTTLPLDRELAMAALVQVLDPSTVEGVEGLEGDPALRLAMADLREELRQAVASGEDPDDVPEVAEAARRLSDALAPLC